MPAAGRYDVATPVLAGLLAATAVSVGGFGVGSVPAQLAGGWLHASAAGRALAWSLCGLGVLALLVCWWLLRRASVQVLLTATALWSLPLLVTVPLFSRDVYAYAGQGHLVDVGLDPYALGPADAAGPLAAEVDDVWARTPSPYGPVFLRLASWLVPGQHVVASVVLLRLLAALGLLLVAWALLRLARDPGRALWLAVANPLVLLHGIGGAHNDLLMAGLVAAGLAVVDVRRRDASVAVAAVLVVTAALVKAPAVVALAFLPFLVPTARVRAAAVAAGTAIVSAVTLTAATGLGWGWLHTLGAGNARRSLLSVSTGVGVLLSNVAGDQAVDVAQTVGLAVGAALVLGLLWRIGPSDPVRGLGLALLVAAVLGPVVQPWYLLWSLPLLAAVAGARLAAGLATATAVTCLLILPTGRHVIRPPLYGVPALVVLAAGYAAARHLRCDGGGKRGRIEACADLRSP